jgi:hypothetical protein
MNFGTAKVHLLVAFPIAHKNIIVMTRLFRQEKKLEIKARAMSETMLDYLKYKAAFCTLTFAN